MVEFLLSPISVLASWDKIKAALTNSTGAVSDRNLLFNDTVNNLNQYSA